VVRGSITDSIPGLNVSIIALPDSTLRIISLEEIARIILKKDDDQKKSRKEKARAISESKNEVFTYYQGYLRGGFVAKDKDGDTGFIKADIINGIGVNGVFSAGIGIGARVPIDGDGIVIPAFVDLRANFLQGNISPVLSFSAGTAFQSYSESDGPGLYVNSALGLRLGSPFSPHFILTIGFEQFEYFGIGDRTTGFGTTLRDVPVEKNLNSWTVSIILAF
jgi:hypothetical protein